MKPFFQRRSSTRDSFHIGLKNSTLVFLTTNLNKIGLKATDVSFCYGNTTKLKQMKLNLGRDENGAIQLFTAT